MGSENEMVAVPEGAVEQAFINLCGALGIPATATAYLDAPTALARLAPAQPDAQQGEDDDDEEGFLARYDYAGEPQPQRLATPSSPALDAATIERCERHVFKALMGAGKGLAVAQFAADSIRRLALPNAEKRHG